MKEKILLCVVYILLSFLLPLVGEKYDVFRINLLVGVSSDFLYGWNEYFCIFCRIVSVILLIFSNYRDIIFNPLFLIHMAKRGNDIIFVSVLAHIIDKNKSWLYSIIICIFRHLMIKPSPGINMFWIFNTYFYTQLKSEAYYYIISLQLLGLYITRNLKNKYVLLFLYFAFDPIGDWASLSIIMNFIVKKNWKSNSNKISFIFLLFGIVLTQASFYSWWSLGIGNSNYSMVASIVCTISLLIPLISN